MFTLLPQLKDKKVCPTVPSRRGFTLLEILLVVGIIAILAGIVIIAINPGRQLAMTRNTERKSDLKQIYNASIQYYIDHNTYPAALPATLTEICDTGTATSVDAFPVGYCDNLVNLSGLVPTYMVSIPKDPLASSIAYFDSYITKAYASDNGTGYKIMKEDTDNKLVLLAPLFELNDLIAIGTTTMSTTSCQTDPSTGFSSGNGSSGDPYKICNWAQLDNMRSDLSADYILTSDLLSSDSDYVGMGDQWNPIGSCGSDCEQMGENAPFSGSFNGGNFTISNLVVYLPVVSGVGLFSYTTGDISNVTLDNVSVSGNSYVGGLAGRQGGGVISNVNVSGSVAGYSYVGGIVGYQAGGTITNSNSSATISEN